MRQTFSIITTEPNDLAAEGDNRKSVIWNFEMLRRLALKSCTPDEVGCMRHQDCKSLDSFNERPLQLTLAVPIFKSETRSRRCSALISMDVAEVSRIRETGVRNHKNARTAYDSVLRPSGKLTPNVLEQQTIDEKLAVLKKRLQAAGQPF